MIVVFFFLYGHYSMCLNAQVFMPNTEAIFFIFQTMKSVLKDFL